jgi:uncharacterized protein (TIGR01777 family)
MAELRRVIVTGATGLIGRQLCQRLHEHGYAVVVFSRDPGAARKRLPGMAEYVRWTASTDGPWTSAVDGAYGVVHLAAANLSEGRWTPKRKQQILDSRVTGTHGIVSAIGAAANKPAVFVSASAVGYYGPRDDTPLDESAPSGGDFPALVCIAWEQEARRAKEFGVRTVVLRTGIVLDPTGGALQKLLIPFRLFVGGPFLPGTQWFSWIHPDDEIGAIMMALEDERMQDAVNLTAPEPVTNRELSATLGKVLGRPSWLPVPGFALRLAVGELAGSLTTGQRVVPRKLEELGYEFKYPKLEGALRDLTTDD